MKAVIILLIASSFLFFHSAEDCVTTDFVSEWETTSNNEIITIPTSGGGYDYTVDWGDGSMNMGVTGDVSHNYASPGIHIVTITGDFPRIFFNDSGDKDKILAVTNWGNNPWMSMSDAFRGCSRLDITAPDEPNLSATTSMSNMFRGCRSLNANLLRWDVSNVVYMDGLFMDTDEFNEPLGFWDTDNVVDMSSMFENALRYNRAVNLWNTSNVTNMHAMFKNSGFHEDLSQWDYTNVANLDEFLSGTVNYYYEQLLTQLNGHSNLVSGVHLDGGLSTYCYSTDDRSDVRRNFNWTFSDGGATCGFKFSYVAAAGTTILIFNSNGFSYNYDVSWGDGTFNTRERSFIRHTYDYPGVYQVEITGIYPAHVGRFVGNRMRSVDQWGDNKWQSVNFMFDEALGFREINAIDVPDLSNVISTRSMFQDCVNLTNPDLNSWDMSTITSTNSMFHGAERFNGKIDQWDLSNVTDMEDMFNNAHLFNQDISSWDMSKVRTTEGMFSGAHSFNQDIGDWDLSSVTNATLMFSGAIAFNQDISSWDMSSLVNARGMFSATNSFNQDIGEWDMSSVTEASSMFSGAIAFNQDIGAWDMSSLVNATSMFRRAIAFNQDISSWDMSNLDDARDMFWGTHSFNQDIGSWDMSSLTETEGMFEEAIAFNQDISSWDVSWVWNMRNMFTGASAFNQDISNWDFRRIYRAEDMFVNSNLSTDNYDRLLNSLECRGGLRNNVNFGGVSYCSGSDARQNIIDTYNWTIQDDGEQSGCVLPEATNITWQGTISSDWCNSGNWSGGLIPSDLDHVTILSTGFHPIIDSLNKVHIYNLEVEDGAALDVMQHAHFVCEQM